MADHSKDLTQIIDYEGGVRGNISKWMSEACLTDVGFNYSVVTVLGSQSSGKSTLLNQLFGTKFQVMDSQMGHSQTTKGLWMGVDGSHECGPTLVIDVEGNDSRERGDDRLVYIYICVCVCVLYALFFYILVCVCL
eukprot:GHVQ01000917.1.p1 GENE.GHVQ01000917.1~~GHVQ01000917.1.p1  ORF type:complete len:136 (+),score=16.21 GHVQ01000917.1:195-602(+)